MRFLGHPLHGERFVLLGQSQSKDGSHFKVQLPDQSVSYLPAKWFVSESDSCVKTAEEPLLLATIDAIRKTLLLVEHLENRTPPNVE